MIKVQYMSWTLWSIILVQPNLSIPDTLGPKNCPDYRTVLSYFTGSSIHIYIAMGPQLTVFIIEVSLFSVHNSRFDCISNKTLLFNS